MITYLECSLNISFSMNRLVGHNNIKWDKRATSECLPLIYLLLCQRECAISVVWCAQHTVPPQWHFISEPRSLSCLSRFYNHLHPVLQRFHISMKPLQALPRQRWSRWQDCSSSNLTSVRISLHRCYPFHSNNFPNFSGEYAAFVIIVSNENSFSYFFISVLSL